MTISVEVLIGAVVSIIVAIFGSTGFWQWVGSNSNKIIKTELAGIRKDFENLKTSEDRKEVKNARRRILRFNDELLNDMKHSKEYFDDILDDTTTYKRYCLEHPEFPNGKTVMAIENIEAVYRKCLTEHKFL